MKRCPNCHTLYDASLPVCPKCGIDEEAAEASAGRKAGAREVRVSWILIAAGVPLLILLICMLCGGIVRLTQ